MHLLVARFVNASKPVSVYSDQTVADAFWPMRSVFFPRRKQGFQLSTEKLGA
jgi:hypothetical protein